jgi:glutaminase
MVRITLSPLTGEDGWLSKMAGCPVKKLALEPELTESVETRFRATAMEAALRSKQNINRDVNERVNRYFEIMTEAPLSFIH